MRLRRLTVRGFRNLADADLAIPEGGLVLFGANGQGKTSLLEAVAYPVLFRSFRTAQDAEVVRFGEAGFTVALDFEAGGTRRAVASGFWVAGRRRRHSLDGAPLARVVDGTGAWLAVAFLPHDVRLAGGPAAERRQFLDRTLSLADPRYLRALARYRSALARRNAALRQRRGDVARAFEGALARAGAVVVATRLAWVAGRRERFTREMIALGETGAEASLGYQGDAALADPDAWPAALDAARARDEAQGATTVGPHRHDVELRLDGHPLREFGSAGQQRTAAIALKLLELDTIEAAAGETPVLLLDDTFAELDADRQARLAVRLFAKRSVQVLVTSPRADELPPGLDLPVWVVERGKVRCG